MQEDDNHATWMRGITFSGLAAEMRLALWRIIIVVVVIADAAYLENGSSHNYDGSAASTLTCTHICDRLPLFLQPQ